jgi:DNA-binding MarR family transcriptional regulator
LVNSNKELSDRSHRGDSFRRTGFFRIPNALLHQYAGSIGPAGIAVFNAIARHANSKNHCWPSIKTIARLAGISPRQASKTIKRLYEVGLIGITRNPGSSNHYTLLLPVEKSNAAFRQQLSAGARSKPLSAIEQHKKLLGIDLEKTTRGQ